jgi:hypothetical protein
VTIPGPSASRRRRTRRHGDLADGIAVEAQGELLVKGKAQPVTVYAVVVDSLVAEGV